MLSRSKSFRRPIALYFSEMQGSNEKPRNQSPVLNDLDLYCMNPLINPKVKSFVSLEETLANLKVKEKALLKHIPHHAPLRQAYYTSVLARRNHYTSRTEWIVAAFLSVFAISTGLERFTFF